MKKIFFVFLFLISFIFCADAQLLGTNGNDKNDPIDKYRIELLSELFQDSHFVGGYYLYLNFFHDFNIEAIESSTKKYKPEVSKRLITYFLDGMDEVNNEIASLYFDRGLARMDSSEYEISMKDFDHVLLLDPHNSDAYVNRAILFIISNQFDEALVELKKAELYDPANPDVYFNRGVIDFNLGKVPESLKEIDTCIKLNPDYSRAWFEKGLILNSNQDDENAIKVLRHARNLGDPDAENLIKLIKDKERKKKSTKK